MHVTALKNPLICRVISGWITLSFLASFLLPSPSFAQSLFSLPEPGSMIVTSPSYVPVILKGLMVHGENPLLFDFIVDTGSSKQDADSAALPPEAQKLVKYFLASLTIPEKDQWVNLSPYEQERVMAQDLEKTDLGRDMLAQDYLLKQVTASLIYPEKDLGKMFWGRVYAEARAKFGVTDIPVDSFNKVWVVADQANIYVNRDKAQDKNQMTAFIVGSHLKVMLEADYFAQAQATSHKAQEEAVIPSEGKARAEGSQAVGIPRSARNDDAAQELSKQILREVIVPSLEKEVNEGKNFANLRQVFHSMILATWYKKALKDALLTQVYANKGKTGGVEGAWVTEKGSEVDPQAIYAQYVETYKKGVFSLIKEDIDQATGETVPRKYFSGGLTDLAKATEVGVRDFAQQDVLPVGRALKVTVAGRMPGSEGRVAGGADAAQSIVDQLNKERPAGYPKRDADLSPYYRNPKLLDQVRSRANLNGYAHPDLDVLKEYLKTSKDSPSEKAKMRAEIMKIQVQIRREIRRFAPWTRFLNGMPHNFVETGMTGRGDLGRYGPNPTETAALFRRMPDGRVEVLVKDRLDGGGVELAGMFIPFGHEATKYYGETATNALKRELGLDVDMTKGTMVFEGPAYDWRDTNDAWVLDRGIATLLSYEESLFLNPEAKEGTKPGSVRWVSTDDLDKLGFYARHGVIIQNSVGMVKDGRLKTAEERRVSKFAPLNITLTQIEKAFQAFKERKTELVKTFDVTVPQAPHGGNYYVAAGIEPVLNDVRRLRFSPDHIQELEMTGTFDSDIGRQFLKYLREFQFPGDFDALQEGRIVQEGMPIMRVRANEVDIELLSDLLRNRLGQAVLIATKTSRIVQAANAAFVSEEAIERLIKEQGLTRDQIVKNRDVIDMSLRRTQGDGGFLAARAAVIGGAVGTSNEKAAMEFNLIDIGSMAHAYMQAFGAKRQKDGFREWGRVYPKTAIFLPDTFGDTMQGIRDAIEVAKEMETWGIGARLFGIRLDSGDLVQLSRDARRMLDEAGLHYVKIVASNDLEEWEITRLIEQGARIDVFGVGTNMGTGGKQATLNVEVKPSEENRFWRSTVNGKISGYITTPSGRVAYANREKGEQVTELLQPIWREGKRAQGIELAWSGHERGINEMGRLFPDQKKLKDGKALPVVHQDSDLTINPETDVVLIIDDHGAFKPGEGGLPVQGGDEIAERIRPVVELFGIKNRYASLDRHPRGHIALASSYVGLPPFTFMTLEMIKDWTAEHNGIAEHALFTLDQLRDFLKEKGVLPLWPDHADDRLPESQLPAYMTESMLKYIQVKGMDPKVHSFSPFHDDLHRVTGLADVIRKNNPGVRRIFIGGGLAYDFCLGFGALGAKEEGFEVFLFRDTTRSVGLPGTVEAMEEKLKAAGVKQLDTRDLLMAANNTQGVYPASIVQGNFSHPPLYDPEPSTAFVKDKYHSTMVNIFVKLGLHKVPAVFDYFFRRAPHGQDRIVLSGLRVLAERLRNFKFTPEQIQVLRRKGIYSEEFLKYLEDFKFTGNIMTLREGSIGFANEPLFKFAGTLAEVLIVESLILNKLNFNSLIATLANLKRLEAGDLERLKEAGLAGAQGEAHAEASLAAVQGGMDATNNLDAILNFGLPPAWSNEEGVSFGAELVTGGDTSAQGGVWKMSDFDGVARIKVGEAGSGKASRPGNKEIFDIEDADGHVLYRVTALEGEKLDLPEGQRAVSPYIPFMTNGEIVFQAEDALDVSAWRAEQNIRYVNIHESRMSPKLEALQKQMIAESLGQMSAGTDAAMKGGIDLDAGKMTMTETGDAAQMTFDSSMMEQLKRGDFSGITPAIVRVVPLVDVPSLLGLSR